MGFLLCFLSIYPLCMLALFQALLVQGDLKVTEALKVLLALLA